MEYARAEKRKEEIYLKMGVKILASKGRLFILGRTVILEKGVP